MTDTDKKARLAAALRENLRKRKAQARETSAPPREGRRFASMIDPDVDAGSRDSHDPWR